MKQLNAKIDRTRDPIQDLATLIGMQTLRKWALSGWAPEISQEQRVQHAARFGLKMK